MTDGIIFFDETVKNDLKANDNIRKIPTVQTDHYTTKYLPGYPYFQKIL